MNQNPSEIVVWVVAEQNSMDAGGVGKRNYYLIRLFDHEPVPRYRSLSIFESKFLISKRS